MNEWVIVGQDTTMTIQRDLPVELLGMNGNSEYPCTQNKHTVVYS